MPGEAVSTSFNMSMVVLEAPWASAYAAELIPVCVCVCVCVCACVCVCVCVYVNGVKHKCHCQILNTS